MVRPCIFNEFVESHTIIAWKTAYMYVYYSMYRFNSGKVVSPMLNSAAGGSRGQWIFSPENHKRLRAKIGGTQCFIRSIFERWDRNGDGRLTFHEIERGLKELMGSDDVTTSALAGKFLEEMDVDDSRSLDPGEFETRALCACKKFLPGLLEEID